MLHYNVVLPRSNVTNRSWLQYDVARRLSTLRDPRPVVIHDLVAPMSFRTSSPCRTMTSFATRRCREQLQWNLIARKAWKKNRSEQSERRLHSSDAVPFLSGKYQRQLNKINNFRDLLIEFRNNSLKGICPLRPKHAFKMYQFSTVKKRGFQY